MGSCLRDLAKQEPYAANEYLFTDVNELDICDKDAVERFAELHKPDVIINSAAYTAVDNAEDDVERAFQINRDAVRNLAQVAKARQMYLVHISTDYVFSGEACHPYRPSDPITPLSVYGKSKAAGEEAIQESGCDATILRTSWLYSEYGKNFVKTMLRLGSERSELNVVYDQIGAPTYAGDLAKAIFAAIDTQRQHQGVQIFHFANQGVTSWYDFAKSIMETAGLTCQIRPILTSEYPAKASRPAYSVFDLSETRTCLKINIPHWIDSLKLTINKL